MTKRYNLCIDEYESFMKEDHNGEYVKYKDVEKILLHNRSHTCAVRHVISSSKLNSVPCYDYQDCSKCDIYQSVEDAKGENK